MSRNITKADFLHDLRTRIARHCEQVQNTFAQLDPQQLVQQPAPTEWSVVQCFDHLNRTHNYYLPRVNAALTDAVPAPPQRDIYRASFWARIYMAFAFNPRVSFPSPAGTAPGEKLDAAVLVIYLRKQDALLQALGRAQSADLLQTRIPIERGVRFNLGDCLKIVVYHDDLHFGQASRMLPQLTDG